MIIGRFLRRWLRQHGEAARLLGSQKSQRFCQIAKSPTSFDPASITSGCRQPLMSAPASVPRVARPSEATAFDRSTYITDTDIIFFMLCAIPTVANSALVKILPPQQGDLLVPSAGCLFGSRCMVFSRWPMRGLLPVADAVLPFRVHRLALRPVEYAGGASRASMRGLLLRADVGSPLGGRYRVTVRG